MKVLVADDNVLNRRLLRAILESEGHEVIETADGVDALQSLETQGADAVISDILMPKMDGYRLCREVRKRERFRDLPFILCSATYVTEADKQLSLRLGANAYMHKPVSADEIFRTLGELAKKHHHLQPPGSESPTVVLDLYSKTVGAKLDEVRSELESKANLSIINVELDEQNRKLREFDRFKTEFLSSASHEMRTPLAIIRDFASLMADGVTGMPNDEQADCLQSIVRNCDRLTSLVGDLLDLARIEAGKMHLRRASLDVQVLLTACVADFAPQFRAKLQSLLLDLPDRLPKVLGDRFKIEQVMVNLIGNAHKFVPDGGLVTVSAREEPDAVRIEVADNGPGMDRFQQTTIFDAFTQLSREDGPGQRGTGLGLTISRKIVEFHDSEIAVTSQVGHGSTFSFSLPIYSAQLEREALLVDETRSPSDFAKSSVSLL